MNSQPRDILATMLIAAAGFVTQMTNLDLLFKVLIGLAAFLFVSFRCFVFVLKNWDAFRSPVKFMKEYRRCRKIQRNQPDEDSTTV